MPAHIERTLIHERHEAGIELSYAGPVPATALRIYQEENGDITVYRVEGDDVAVVTLDDAALAAIVAAARPGRLAA